MSDRPDVRELLTPRLIGEALDLSHEAILRDLLQDPRVAETLGGIASDDDVRKQLVCQREHWQRYGFGYWLLRDRQTGVPIGRGGLRRVEIDGCEETERAIAVASQYWNRGFGSEMGHAFLRLAFEDLNLASVVAFTLPTNISARRVMQKHGFRYEREIVWRGFDLVLYRKLRSDWPGVS